MDGSESRSRLASLLLSGSQFSMSDAVELASHMSISDVVAALEDDVSESHAELCEAFVDKWLQSLSAVERLAAHWASGSLYVADLLGLPNSQVRYLQRMLVTTADAAEEAGSYVADCRGLADTPDTSFDEEFYDDLLHQAEGPLRELTEALRAGALRVGQLIDEAAADDGEDDEDDDGAQDGEAPDPGELDAPR